MEGCGRKCSAAFPSRRVAHGTPPDTPYATLTRRRNLRQQPHSCGQLTKVRDGVSEPRPRQIVSKLGGTALNCTKERYHRLARLDGLTGYVLTDARKPLQEAISKRFQWQDCDLHVLRKGKIAATEGQSLVR
jgi:hypothetical protein